MSMISSLIDELNKSADEWSSSNMFELARMCRDAADTISELRDDLQRAKSGLLDAEHDESVAWDRVCKAEAENARLRELVRYIMHQCNDGNPRCGDCIEWNDDECVALRRIRELGIEVYA